MEYWLQGNEWVGEVSHKFGGEEGTRVERVESAFQAGVAEAERDIASGKLKLRYGARGAWGEDLARTLQSRFGVELVVLTCFTTAESVSFEAGYNATIEAHVDAVHGSGSVKAVWDEIQRLREARVPLFAGTPANNAGVH